MTEEPPIKWTREEPWPHGWHPRPRFAACHPPGIEFIEVVNDTYMRSEWGYPTGQLIGIPDRIGRTTDDEWVLWEEKTKDSVGYALRELDQGLYQLRRLKRPVHMLGLTLERFDPMEAWRTSHEGYLMKKGQVSGTPHDISGLPVMVERRT